MDIGLLTQVLQTCLSPSASFQDREAAHLKLEAFKHRPDSLELCVNLFKSEFQSTTPKDFILHFALRTGLSLLREQYESLHESRKSFLKQFVLDMLSLPHWKSALVEHTVIAFAVEVFRLDENMSANLQSLVNVYQQQQQQQPRNVIVLQVLIEFSSSLVDEFDDSLASTQLSRYVKFMQNTFSPKMLPLALKWAEEAIAFKSDEQSVVQSLLLLGECLRWCIKTPEGKNVQDRILGLVQQCGQNVAFPTKVIQASFSVLQHFIVHKKCDENRTKTYACLSALIVQRTGYQNEDEFYLANDVFLSCVNSYASSFWLADLERLTFHVKTIPLVLRDYLHTWRELIRKRTVSDMSTSWVQTLVQLCTMATVTVVSGEEADEEEEDETPFFLLQELSKQYAAVVLKFVCEHYFEANNEQQILLMASLSSSVVSGASAFPSELVVPLLEKVFLSRPKTLGELRVLHVCVPLILQQEQQAFLGKALEYFVEASVSDQLPSKIKKRAANYLLAVLNKMQAKKQPLLALLLPQLLARVSQAFPSLTGPERFILLECILVSGKALPSEEERIQLTRTVLAHPLEQLTLHGPKVIAAQFFLVPPPLPAALERLPPWNERGYVADMEFLATESKQFITALMTLSTCAREGAITDQVWELQLLPCALACLDQVNLLFRQPQAQHARFLLIHPVDARVLVRHDEEFVDELVEYGEKHLGLEGTAIVALLSSVRSCSLELIRNCASKVPRLFTPEVMSRLFSSDCQFLEHRHLAMLLNSTSGLAETLFVQHRSFFQPVLHHVFERLRQCGMYSNTNNPFWDVHVFRNCTPQTGEQVNVNARMMLENSFASFLSRVPLVLEDFFVYLCDRLVFGNAETVKTVLSLLRQKYLLTLPVQSLIQVGLPRCVQACGQRPSFSSESENKSKVFGLMEFATELVSVIAFGVLYPQFALAKSKKKKVSFPDLLAYFSPSLVNKFTSEVTRDAISPGTFRACVVELFSTLLPKPAEGEVAAVLSTAAVTAQKKSSSKKKKSKKKSGSHTTPGEDKCPSPPWHKAVDPSDLGMVSLFGSNDFDDL